MGKLIGLDKLGTLLEPILHLIGKKAERPSWNENDPSSTSYIEGRTHYTGEDGKVHKIPSKYLPPMDYVSYDKSQDLTPAQMRVARDNIGAGTSFFDGSYNSLSDKPTDYVKTVNGFEPDGSGNVDATEVAFNEYYKLKIGAPKFTGCSFAIQDLNGRVYSELYHSGLSIYVVPGDTSRRALMTSDALTIGTSSNQVKLQANVGASSDALLYMSNSSSDYISIAADGNISVGGGILTFGSGISPTILRYVKAPEGASDAANKAYVDKKTAEPAYELIETITLEEGATEVVRTDLSLAKVNLYLTIPRAETTLSIGGSIDNGAGMIGEIWLGSAINADGARYAHVHAESANGWAFVDNESPTATASAVGTLQRSSSGMEADTPITKITLYASGGGAFPAGTVIKVFGVIAAG